MFQNFASPRDIAKNENSCQNPSFLLFSWESVLIYTHTMLLQCSNIENKLSTGMTNQIFSCPVVTHCTNPARIPLYGLITIFLDVYYIISKSKLRYRNWTSVHEWRDNLFYFAYAQSTRIHLPCMITSLMIFWLWVLLEFLLQ